MPRTTTASPLEPTTSAEALLIQALQARIQELERRVEELVWTLGHVHSN